MPSSYDQALVSTDAEVVKLTRASYKGKLTRVLTALKTVLQHTGVGDSLLFDHASIDQDEVNQLVSDLRHSKELLEELHTRYEITRKHEADEAEESVLEKRDSDYIQEVDDNIRAALRLYNSYTVQIKASQQIKSNQEKLACEVSQFPERFKLFQQKRSDYEGVWQEALKVVESGEIGERRTADFQKTCLRQEFDKLEKMGSELLSLVPHLTSGLEDDDKELLECSKERLNFRQTITNLEKVVKEVEALERKELAQLAKPANVVKSASGTESGSEKSKFLKLKVTTPSFSGKSREFAVFKRDFNTIVSVDGRTDVEIGALLKESVPQKWKYLLDKVTLNDHKEMMEILTNKFGRARIIVDECTAEIRRMKVVSTDKEFIHFVEQIDKLKRDLDHLGLLSDIANTTVISDLEAKLPYGVKRDWVKLVSSKEYASKLPREIFAKFLEFLEDTKLQAEYHNIEIRSTDHQGRAVTKLGFVGGVEPVHKESAVYTKEPARKEAIACLVCGDGATDLKAAMHPTGSCAVWKSMTLKEKNDKVNCVRCPYNGKETKHTTAECQKKKLKCHNCHQDDDHHTWFCTRAKSKTNTSITKTMIGSDVQGLLPVMVKTAFISTLSPSNNRSGKLGGMFDDCSTDHYITHEAASKYQFPGQDVELEVEGIGGVDQVIATTMYRVTVFDLQGRCHEYQCYGLDKIASADIPEQRSYERICSRFGVRPADVRKPRNIDLLISLRASAHHPGKVRSIGHMSLYDGVFGKVLGGTDDDLVFVKNYVSSMPAMVKGIKGVSKACTLRAAVQAVTLSSSKKSDREFLDLLLEDNIGVDCHPKCGGCRCGRCPTGAKPMSLQDEREYVKFRDNLIYDEKGVEDDPGPYWRTKLPWNIDKMELADNKPAVLGVMNATKRRLQKDPSWEDVYESQLKELIHRGFAREIPPGELADWVAKGGKVYYMPHQVALNLSSKSTPVRVVFNNTLTYRGYSMNASLDLGPDILTNLHGLLLRFRADVVAAAGDIKKMYYMVRVTLEDVYMQLFVWCWKGEEKIRTFAMTRLVMGNKPSGPIACVAVNETAKLYNYEVEYPAAHEALTNNSYVDNTFITGPDITKVKADIAETEFVAGKGGFFYKEWIISGQDVPEQVIAVHLPNQISAEEEKALGVDWDVGKDTLAVKVDVSRPAKKLNKKNQFSVQVSPYREVHVFPHLTLRIALSIHAKAYDPLGLILPCKMVGSLLLRLTIQVLRKEAQGPVPWDEIIDGDLERRWSEYFTMLVSLADVRFPRSFKPIGCNPDIGPTLATFSDGNPDSFGTCAYAVWTLLDGSRVATLIMSKAKLSAILQKGETVRNELSGAVLNCRLKEWIMKNSGVTFQHHFSFIDSRIVQAMIQKTSYGYSTFAGLRVGEIQQKSDCGAWYHIPSAENISDILTRGARPDLLGPGSVWQCGPRWLVLEEECWPVTKPGKVDLNQDELEMEKKFRVKSICKVAKVSSAQLDSISPSTMVSRKDVPNLDIIILRTSSLKRLIRTTALILRVILKDLKIKKNIVNEVDTEVGCSTGSWLDKIGEVSASEYRDAWLFLVEYDQQLRLCDADVRRLVPAVIEEQLANYDYKVKHTVIGGRVKSFPVGFSSNSHIPILSPSPLGKLVVLHYHNKFHKEPDTIVAHTRRDVWVIRCRKLASSIDSRCRMCLLGRKQRASQLMGDLPSIRSSDTSPAWAAVNMDLFGPLWIRDECVKRGPRVNKKVWGIIFCCTRTRGIYLDIASDYSTESVLHAVRRLLASKGQVQTIVSDCGLQLKGADKEMSDWRRGWDTNMLRRFSAEKGLDWQFVMPHSQHQNGAAEILIKLVKGVKVSYMRALGDIKLTYNEMHTMFLEIAQLCNERPIGMKPNSSTDPEYLSPNSLFLGRASDRIASGPFQQKDLFEDDPEAVRTRFHLVQSITNQFWKVWTRIYFPTLLVRQKWHTARRNLQVGDVCVMQDSSLFRGEWRLVLVTTTFPDEKGVVRNVEVRASSKQDGSKLYKPHAPNFLKRHVSNLVVLVPKDEDDAV